MKRRHFVMSTAAVVTAVESLSAPAEQTLTFDRRITLPPIPGATIQEMTISRGRVYMLMRKRTDIRRYTISQSDLNGSAGWSATLDDLFIHHICPLADGHVLALAAKPQVARDRLLKIVVSPTGDIGDTIISDLPIAPCSAAICGDTLVTFYLNDATSVRLSHWRNATTERTLSTVFDPMPIAGYVPPAISGSVELLGQDEVGLLDHTYARIATLHPSSGKYATATIGDELVERGREAGRRFITEYQARPHTVQTSPAMPQVLGPSTATEFGKILCVPSPTSVTAPAVLQIGAAGVVEQKFICVLPDRPANAEKLPAFLMADAKSVIVGFHEDDLFVFTA